jgi:GcrA cell cycle regulator
MSVSSVAALSGWTDECVTYAGKLWADGHSAAHIAKQLRKDFGLSVSRSAVLGKLHRLKLSGRQGASALGETRAAKPRHIGRPRSIAPSAPRAVKIAGRGAVFVEATARRPRVVVPIRAELPGTATVLTIGRHQCKWPIGDPQDDDFTFCGVRTDGTYCAEHHQRSHQAIPANRPQTGNELARSLRRYM